MSMVFVVGLTGGIGSGKTTAAGLFAQHGAEIVDTDEIARLLTGPHQPAVKKIARHFGPQYVASDGALDRARMRALVFTDAKAKLDLEAILHPLIMAQSALRIAASTAPYVIVVVPLLFETGVYRSVVKRVLVVDCDEKTQIRRVLRRSKLSREEVASIVASQISRAERLRGADDVIRNEGDVASLEKQVVTLHRKYLALAEQY